MTESQGATTAQEISEKVLACITAAQEAQGGDADAVAGAIAVLTPLQSLQVTRQLLGETNAGKTIKKLTKHANPDIAAAAKRVIDSWMEAVKKEQEQETTTGGTGVGTDASKPEVPTTPRASAPGNGGQERERKEAGEGVFMPPAKRQKSEALSNAPSGGMSVNYKPPKPIPSGDPSRDKTRQLLGEALALALVDVPDGDIAGVAAEVEEAMHRGFGGFKSQQYKTKYRSLSFNLKDANNPDLRRRVLSREIPGEALVQLPPGELASDERKQGNSKIREQALFEAERGQNLKKATTDQFQCGKCKQRKTTYFQMQTRSADEPMTTFVTCVNCFNRWKFC